MKTATILLICLLAGCASSPPSSLDDPFGAGSTDQPRAATRPENLVNPFTTFASADVAKVVLCTDAVPQPKPGVYPLSSIGIETTDRDEIKQMYRSVTETQLTDDLSNMPFCGIISHQAFLDAKGRVLAVIHIPCDDRSNDSMVIVSEGYADGGTMYLGRDDEIGEFFQLGYSEAFSKIVKSLMSEQKEQTSEQPFETHPSKDVGGLTGNAQK